MQRTLIGLLLAVLCVLPSGAHAAPYRAVLYDGARATPVTRLAVLALAGIVNRDSARLYLLNVYETWSYSRTDETWRDLYRTRAGVEFDSTTSLMMLVERFRPFLRGAVTYDSSATFSNFPGQSFCWQGEQAALLGALTDRLPLPSSYASLLSLATTDSVLISDAYDGDRPVWAAAHLEEPGHAWNAPGQTPEQRYLTLLDWTVTNLLPVCSPEGFYLREITDFTVARRLFQVNLAGTGDLDLNSMPVARADILERILTFLHSKNPVTIFHIYGWMRPEPMTQWFAFFGSSFHETLLANLSWHAAFPVPQRSFSLPARQNPDSVMVKDKHYLVFIGSEGDASNWVFGFQSGAWLSPSRGSVPVGWGWNLHLLSLCPFVASYYYDTATPEDGFLSVTSPLGYAYPDLWAGDVRDAALDSTRALLARFDISEVYGYKHYASTGTLVYRGKTISNSFNFSSYGSFQQASGVSMTFLFDPLLPSQVPVTTYGTPMFSHTGDGSFYGNASDPAAMAARILSTLQGRARPGFLLAGYQRLRQDDFAARTSPASSDISLPRLGQVISLLQADPALGASIEVVTPQRFTALLRRKLGLSSARFAETGSAAVSLEQNYPNPFNGTTVIAFELPSAGTIRLDVFDLTGRRVTRLAQGEHAAGRHVVRWETSGVAAGVYFTRLSSAQGTVTRRAVLVR